MIRPLRCVLEAPVLQAAQADGNDDHGVDCEAHGEAAGLNNLCPSQAQPGYPRPPHAAHRAGYQPSPHRAAQASRAAQAQGASAGARDGVTPGWAGRFIQPGRSTPAQDGIFTRGVLLDVTARARPGWTGAL
jgi:hypothetical protein